LNGMAIAVAVAIAMPALAQAQDSGARPMRPKVPATAGASAGYKPVAGAPRTGLVVIAQAGRSPGDNVANQLNQQELQRLGPASAPAAMTAPRAPAPVVAPGPSAGGSSYIRPGVPGPVSTAPGAADGGPRVSGGGYIPAPTGPVPMPPPPPIAAPIR
jgi:hypothetical protein